VVHTAVEDAGTGDNAVKNGVEGAIKGTKNAVNVVVNGAENAVSGATKGVENEVAGAVKRVQNVAPKDATAAVNDAKAAYQWSQSNQAQNLWQGVRNAYETPLRQKVVDGAMNCGKKALRLGEKAALEFKVRQSRILCRSIS
jgi:hypothetical protein